MKKRIFWTTAALLTAVLGMPLASAETNQADNSSQPNRRGVSAQISSPARLMNVLKVGEYQASGAKTNRAGDAVIARIQPHEQAGQQAATLYVHGIPAMTFLGKKSATTSNTKVGTPQSSTQTKMAAGSQEPDLRKQVQQNSSDGDRLHAADSPVWRATAVAAKLNQLSQEQLEPNQITVSWNGSSDPAKKEERYLIKVKDRELVEIDAQTRLPKQTNNLAEEALQVTNRLRRLLGNAPPLQEVSGMPKPAPKQQEVASVGGAVRARLSGMASWYGPGFHGNRTANGEVYNQNSLTAAHKHLPFGTRVRVTNRQNGRSVVVRINDRGPYIGGRIIDLSAAAARMVGVMQSGVAPVRVEVLD